MTTGVNMNLEQYLPEFLSLALVHFILVVIPGPDFVITVRQSIQCGRTHGIMTAIGIGIGLSVHVIYTLLGVAAITHTIPWLLQLLKITGALYLCYLGLTLIKSSKNINKFRINTGVQPSNQSLKKSFILGFLTNVFNPKATLFFIAVMMSIVNVNTPLPIKIGYGIWMCTVNAVWFILVSLLFSKKVFQKWFQKQTQKIERICGGILLLFSVQLMFF